VSEESAVSLTSSQSCGLDRKSKNLEERNMVTEQQPLEQKNLTSELSQKCRSACLEKELEETLEGMYMITY
jgi:hypothetical protein